VSHSSEAAVTRSTATARTTTSTPTPATTEHRAKPAVKRDPRHKPSPHTRRALARRVRPHRRAPGTSRPRAGSQPVPTVPAKPPAPAAYLPVPTRLIKCLDQARLSNVGRAPSGLPVGTDPASGRPVYVDGPYRTRSAAAGEAASRASGDSAERGGLYVVYAALSDHLGKDVHAVAACLNRPPGPRKLTF
jgi:hypothetical protein